MTPMTFMRRPAKMKRLLKRLMTLVVVTAAVIFGARLAFPLPDLSERPDTLSIPADPTTLLGGLMADAMVMHPGKSGILPLEAGRDAFASRLALVAAAQHSIDAQYYIWHNDTSGIILLDALLKAARRGVRVRLLLDDNGIPGLDRILATLNAQEHFQIRLFNPSTLRTPKLLGYTFDFFRMNRRMHNKSLIVDGAAAIIGGRNIGDEYFEVGDDAFFVDMDVLATGGIIPETAVLFDQYWNSASSFGVEHIIGAGSDTESFNQRVARVMDSPAAGRLTRDVLSSVARYTQGLASLEWTDVRLVADDPAKGQGRATGDQLMITQLGRIIGSVEQRLDLASAYFIPGKTGTEYFTRLALSGKEIRILTNALNTTDVTLVHVGYTKYRRELLKSGILLYELKLRGEMTSEDGLQLMPIGLSGGSLHAKTFAIDGSRVFIGSFNFDPRSALLNCEMGFLIDSSNLAQRISAAFDGPLKTVSYRPELTPEGKMVWHEPLDGGGAVTYQEEPGASWFQQITFVVIGLLPVEWLL